MTAWRQVLELSMEMGFGEAHGDRAVANGAGKPGGAGADAAGVWEDPSFFAAGRALGMHHQTVQRCVERAVAYGALADPRRPAATWQGADYHGRGQGLVGGPGLSQGEGTGLSARVAGRRGCWLVTRANMARRWGMTAWPALPRHCLQEGSQPAGAQPHKVRYYLERRDAELIDQDGKGAVRLPRGRHPEEYCSLAKAQPGGGYRFLR